jgi:hypothetical protein
VEEPGIDGRKIREREDQRSSPVRAAGCRHPRLE